MYDDDFLNDLATKKPNEVLALTRALVLLNQLPQETLDKVSNKLAWTIDDNPVKSGDYRAGALKAETLTTTFDMTETQDVNLNPMPTLDGTLETSNETNLDKIKMQWRTEFKNILPRIDYIIKMPNPKNAKETRYFQKQVNTDGTSHGGRRPITGINYNFDVKKTNIVDLGDQSADKPTWLNTILSSITGKGKYESVLKELNGGEEKNQQIRVEAAKQYLKDIAENPASNTDPKLAAFIAKVEKALGK